MITITKTAKVTTEAVGPRPVPTRRRFRLTARWLLVGWVLLFVVAWELTSRIGIVDPMFVSRPSAIIAAYPDLLADAQVRARLWTTFAAVLKGFFLAALGGVVLGYSLGSVRLLRDAFYGPLLFLLSVPKSVFIPIFMVFFGINTTTAAYYGAFSGVVYVTVNVIGGLDLVEPRHLLVAKAFGARFRHRVLDIVLPASLPGVVAGVWYGLKNSLQGVLIFELFISVGGIGQEIKRNTNALRTDRVFALILGVSIAAILLGSGWTAIERRLTRWRPTGAATTAADT